MKMECLLHCFHIIPNILARKQALLFLGERSEPRENAERENAVASPLTCLSHMYFSRYPPNGELGTGYEWFST